MGPNGFKRADVFRHLGGSAAFLPETMTDAAVGPLVRVYIEMADFNSQDASGAVSMFRIAHGKGWTVALLQRIIAELVSPTLTLEIEEDRATLLPLFRHLLAMHEREP